MKNKYIYTIFRVLFCSIFLLASPIKSKTILDITENDFLIGEDNAPVTIIEYSSLSCSHCANFHNDTLSLLKNEYIDTGKVKMVFRDFPFNYPALLGGMVLRCIPNDVRYDYMNALFQLQSDWVVKENKKSANELYKIMQSGGMTKNEFDNCIQDRELENTILQNVIDAQNEFNIKSTPSFLINGFLVEGNKSIKEFRQILDKILSE
jgi:protein-disulfide isomerase